MEVVNIDQEGLWSVFQESVDYNHEVLKNKFLQQRYRDVFLTVLKLLLTSSSKI